MGKRSVRPVLGRWTDDLVKTAGSRWMQVASDRSRWKSIGEACVQQWTVRMTLGFTLVSWVYNNVNSRA